MITYPAVRAEAHAADLRAGREAHDARQNRVNAPELVHAAANFWVETEDFHSIRESFE